MCFFKTWKPEVSCQVHLQLPQDLPWAQLQRRGIGGKGAVWIPPSKTANLGLWGLLAIPPLGSPPLAALKEHTQGGQTLGQNLGGTSINDPKFSVLMGVLYRIPFFAQDTARELSQTPTPPSAKGQFHSAVDLPHNTPKACLTATEQARKAATGTHCPSVIWPGLTNW